MSPSTDGRVSSRLPLPFSSNRSWPRTYWMSNAVQSRSYPSWVDRLVGSPLRPAATMSGAAFRARSAYAGICIRVRRVPAL
ncbi:hypothetical protein ACN28S_64355 [Cystobacter fuscus]